MVVLTPQPRGWCTVSLADVTRCFIRTGGEFLVAEQDGHLVGMGGMHLDTATNQPEAMAF
jgi:hypothetical protein